MHALQERMYGMGRQGLLRSASRGNTLLIRGNVLYVRDI